MKGKQGWEQLLASKHGMLIQYEVAKKFADAHIVKTSHGNSAEAIFREWLAGFLPQRFGVTSGYIISQHRDEDVKVPHYDVIVYDRLASPVIWIEGDPDTSLQGAPRALPLDFVYAVLEVKAAFTLASAKDAISHLAELDELLEDLDESPAGYRKYLPREFVRSVVFFEARKADEFSAGALDACVPATPSRGWGGGLILSGEGREIKDTGRLIQGTDTNPMVSNVGDGKESLLGAPIANSKAWTYPRGAGTTNFCAKIEWAPIHFSAFFFNLIARLNGHGGSHHELASLYATPPFGTLPPAKPPSPTKS